MLCNIFFLCNAPFLLSKASHKHPIWWMKSSATIVIINKGEITPTILYNTLHIKPVFSPPCINISFQLEFKWFNMITRKSKVTCKPVGILPCADPEIYPGILGPEGGGRGIIFVSQFMIIKLCEFSKSEFSKGGGVEPTRLF